MNQLYVLFSSQIKGYQGLVFCPDRRFCLYPDVTPPLEDSEPLPARDSRWKELHFVTASCQDVTNTNSLLFLQRSSCEFPFSPGRELVLARISDNGGCGHGVSHDCTTGFTQEVSNIWQSPGCGDGGSQSAVEIV